MPRRRLLVGSLATLIGLAVLVEIGLRVTMGLGTPPLLQADSTIGYLFQANQDVERFGKSDTGGLFQEQMMDWATVQICTR
jgi:hypothetical protein